MVKTEKNVNNELQAKRDNVIITTRINFASSLNNRLGTRPPLPINIGVGLKIFFF